jgi:hypothetical protein
MRIEFMVILASILIGSDMGRLIFLFRINLNPKGGEILYEAGISGRESKKSLRTSESVLSSVVFTGNFCNPTAIISRSELPAPPVA